MAKMVKIKWGERGKEPAAAAVGCSLSYHDSDVGNPLPAFTPRREPGFHLGIQNLRNTLVSPLDNYILCLCWWMRKSSTQTPMLASRWQRKIPTSVATQNVMGAGETQPLLRS